jgi:hypothetical protein
MMAWSMYINQRSISITNEQGKIIARVQVEEGSKDDNFSVANQIVNANKRLKQAQEEITRLREALSKYADGANWGIMSEDGSEPDEWYGVGEGPSIAKAALEKASHD